MKGFKRSALTSIFTTGVDFLVLTVLVEWLHVHYVTATFFGTVAGASSNFLINRKWAFSDTRGMMHWQVVRFLPVQAGSSGLQTLGVWLFTNYSRLTYLGSKLVVSTLVYLCWNFPMNRWFVFPQARESRPA